MPSFQEYFRQNNLHFKSSPTQTQVPQSQQFLNLKNQNNISEVTHQQTNGQSFRDYCKERNLQVGRNRVEVNFAKKCHQLDIKNQVSRANSILATPPVQARDVTGRRKTISFREYANQRKFTP